ncbi:MAG TPA: ORF6N domain-containing protein [Candidatus Binatia bacterium]|nr:ORF6N domain-containing protein [Candidatus Binatia bacterium]
MRRSAEGTGFKGLKVSHGGENKSSVSGTNRAFDSLDSRIQGNARCRVSELYGVPTKVLNQAVKRNKERFPDDFMFQLTAKEFAILKSQPVTSSQWGWSAD